MEKLRLWLLGLLLNRRSLVVKRSAIFDTSTTVLQSVVFLAAAT